MDAIEIPEPDDASVLIDYWGGVAYGASIMEKHLCLSRSAGGPDASFSLEPAEFAQLVIACRDAWEATRPSSSPAQKDNLQFRRSIC